MKGMSNGGLSKNNDLNNILIILGGTTVAFLAYQYITNQQKLSPVVATVSKSKSKMKNIDVSTGKPYHRLSMMSRSFEGTETPPTPPDTTTIKKNILSMILNNASNISTVIGALDTINAKIETYTAQLQLVLQQKAAGTLTQYQVDQYTRQLVIDIATALQIQLSPYFTGSSGTNEDGSTGIPGYYNDYTQYLNDLYKRYYEYYQPSYQYYPGNNYNYYQPQQYQYPYPYMPSTQYPGQSSYGFNQGYYPYSGQPTYPYGQSMTNQYQTPYNYYNPNPYSQGYGGQQGYQDPYAYLYGGYGQGQQQGSYF
jgi:hypothetical protein